MDSFVVIRVVLGFTLLLKNGTFGPFGWVDVLSPCQKLAIKTLPFTDSFRAVSADFETLSLVGFNPCEASIYKTFALLRMWIYWKWL